MNTNYTHPNCGNLTDAEREALIYIRYRSSCDLKDAWSYITRFRLGSPMEALNTLIAARLITHLEGHLCIDHLGREVVDALEAGGW